MEHTVGQSVEFMHNYQLKKGVITLIEKDDDIYPYLVESESGKWWIGERNIEAARVYAENERLRAVIADVKRVATGLYERAPTEGVTELLYYLSVMQREFDLALAESEE